MAKMDSTETGLDRLITWAYPLHISEAMLAKKEN